MRFASGLFTETSTTIRIITTPLAGAMRDNEQSMA
jgi:hypothetical protein